MKTTQSNTRWWWKKRASPITKKYPTSSKNSIHSTVNGADENASIFTLHSYSGSIITPSNKASSSLYPQKSEYSGTFSDVESNASIMSKPWTSQEIMVPESSLYSVPVIESNSSKRRGSLVDFIKIKAGRLVGNKPGQDEQRRNSVG